MRDMPSGQCFLLVCWKREVDGLSVQCGIHGGELGPVHCMSCRNVHGRQGVL